MTDNPGESNDTEESDLDQLQQSTSSRFHSFSVWLNKFETRKLECYSVIFGIAGTSCLALALCILIIIQTTHEHHLTKSIDCSVINITHTHVKLCPSHRCRILNSCIPYVCTIIYVSYPSDQISYESKLYPLNSPLNSSCSYEPSSCLSHTRVQFEQITFLKTFLFNISKTPRCCLHSVTQQPMACPNHLSPVQYSISILFITIGILIGLFLILIGLLTQLHFNKHFKTSKRQDKDFLDTILNFQFSSGTVRSSHEKTTPVNYDLLTQTISHPNTPSMVKTNPNDDLLLFDIGETKKYLQKESLRSQHREQIQNEIFRQLSLDQISDSLSLDHRSSPISASHPHVRFLVK